MGVVKIRFHYFKIFPDFKKFIMSFVGGRALSQTATWLELFAHLHQNTGISASTFCSKSIRNNGIDVLDPTFTNSKLPVKFRSKLYENFSALKNDFIPNSQSIRDNLEIVLLEISRLINAKVVTEIDEATALAQDSCLNPVLWFTKVKDDGSTKHRLVMQAKINCFYARPKMNLPDVIDELHNFVRLENMVKHDLRGGP